MRIKNLLLATLLVIGATVGFAQAPQKFNYQAVVRDGSGNVLPSQSVGMEISIRQTTAGGTIIYTETHSGTTSSIGLINLEIGGGTPTLGSFATIDWSAGPYFVEIGLDPTGGTSYTTMGTQQLLSVPYALYAGNSAEVDGDTTNEIQTLSISNDTISISSGNSIVLPSSAGSDNDWSVVGNDMFSIPVGNVVIGSLVNPSHRLSVGDTGFFAVGIGHAGNFNEIESGRLVFTEDINFAGTCGFEFWHDGSANTLSVVSGCTTLGDTSIVLTRTGEVRIPERVKVGENSNPACDIHIKQSSEGTSPSGAGIRFEALTTTNQNQIWTDGSNLNFGYNGTRVSLITNTGTYTVISDRRLKNTINPLGSVLDKVLKLEPVDYYYNHVKTDVKSIGFIAQDVKEIFPQLVNTNDEGMLAVQYMEFGVIAIKAIQEQQVIINDLQSEIEVLKASIDELKSIVKKVDNVDDINTKSSTNTEIKGNSYKTDADQ